MAVNGEKQCSFSIHQQGLTGLTKKLESLKTMHWFELKSIQLLNEYQIQLFKSNNNNNKISARV